MAKQRSRMPRELARVTETENSQPRVSAAETSRAKLGPALLSAHMSQRMRMRPDQRTRSKSGNAQRSENRERVKSLTTTLWQRGTDEIGSAKGRTAQSGLGVCTSAQAKVRCEESEENLFRSKCTPVQGIQEHGLGHSDSESDLGSNDAQASQGKQDESQAWQKACETR